MSMYVIAEADYYCVAIEEEASIIQYSINQCKRNKCGEERNNSNLNHLSALALEEVMKRRES